MPYQYTERILSVCLGCKVLHVWHLFIYSTSSPLDILTVSFLFLFFAIKNNAEMESLYWHNFALVQICLQSNYPGIE